MEIIRVEHLDKIYRNDGVAVQALRDISFSIDRGEFLSLAGPSGSGKTTLLNLIGLLDEPTGGSVFLEGNAVAGLTRSERSAIRLHKMGFVFQAYNLIPVLSALENIEFSMMLLGIPDRERHARARDALAELGIGDLAGKRPHQMSGGQQQRVAVARAIVHNPPIVLADEPTANLDSVTAHALIDLMERMCVERGITFVFSSHDKKVLDHARRILVLEDGTLKQ